jgi:hypothetical protein
MSVSLKAQDKGNEGRITLFPSHKITEKVTGFAYLGYVFNPEKNYQTYYLGWPAAAYTASNWLQIWGGIVGGKGESIIELKQDELIYFD